jgi:response regulator of citrate/malate metabolism
MENNTQSTGEDVKVTTSSTADTANAKDVKEQAGEKTIPYERFKEINTKYKEAEKTIQELESYKQQILDKEKKATEDEALKR